MADCTIVIPVYNQLADTRRCLARVLRHTDVACDLVIVDNGSRDGTRGFLNALRRRSARLGRLTVIRNETNRGVAPAWNQGLRAAAPGRPVCVLNNDVVVTSGWLSAVLELLAERPEVGIAGPHVTDGPDLPPDYDAWAAGYVVEHGSRFDEGFHGCCFVLTPEVVDRVGTFDERFEVAYWEDVDYCHRARLAGFRPLVTHRAVVHHFISRTIHSLAAELKGRDPYGENLRRFQEKWGIELGDFTVARSMLRKPVKCYPRQDGLDLYNAQWAAIASYCQRGKGLDVGCGSWKVSPHAIGVDVNPLVEPDVVCDAARLPFPDGSVDFVAAVHSLEEFVDTENALTEWSRVLKPGGHLCLVVRDRRFVADHESEQNVRPRSFAPEELRALVERLTRLEVVQHDTIRDEHSFELVARRRFGAPV